MHRWLIAVLAIVVTTALFGATTVDASSQLVERHLLLIRERGEDGICLSRIPQPPLGRPQKLSDHYQLLAARSGGRLGPVLARAISATWTTKTRCGLNVSFRVPSNLGPFDFYDATTGDIWFNLRLTKLLAGRWVRTVIALRPH